MLKLHHGACYYPELWPESEIDRDIAEMRKLGLNFVRVGEFGWSKIEPREGAFSMDFFLRVLDRLHRGGLGVVYCTPTPTPPIWLTDRHPERCFVDAEGTVMSHGARQHVSYEHPAVRKACLTVVEKIATAVGDHPALVAWQIDNEFKCHVAEDFSEAAISHWHRWLEEKFGTIDRLNQAWGTEIWSERYESFEQVPAPKKTPFLHHASLSTAFRLFSRESIAEFLDAQCEIIRRFSRAPITHNFAVPFAVSFERMSRNLDFVSFDNYPDRNHWAAIVFDNDLFRHAKPERGHWFMETSVAHNGWLGNHEITHPPGFLEAEAVVSFALGAEAINYWLWRQQRSGCEISHSAIMSAWFKPTLGYPQVQAVERARERLEKLLSGNRVAPAGVGLTWSDRGRAMLQTEPLGGSALHSVDYAQIMARWHRLCVDLGFHREIRFEGAELGGLKLLITPAMLAVDDDFLARVEDFVAAGGIWICGPLVGHRSTEHTVSTDAALGKLEKFAGVETTYAFPVTGTGSRGEAFGLSTPLAGWCSAFQIGADAKVIGKLRCEQAPDLAWITERRLGKGLIVMLGAEAEGDEGSRLFEALLSHYAERAGIRADVSSSRGTLVCPRCDDAGRRFWVIVNLDGQGGEVTQSIDTVDLVSGFPSKTGAWKIDRYEWRVLAEKI